MSACLYDDDEDDDRKEQMNNTTHSSSLMMNELEMCVFYTAHSQCDCLCACACACAWCIVSKEIEWLIFGECADLWIQISVNTSTTYTTTIALKNHFVFITSLLVLFFLLT